jgi:hypothetical protein
MEAQGGGWRCIVTCNIGILLDFGVRGKGFYLTKMLIDPPFAKRIGPSQ